MKYSKIQTLFKRDDAEGLVLKTTTGLLRRNGERLITKIKTVDFRKYRDSQVMKS